MSKKPVPPTLGERVKQRRQSLHISQAALAQEVTKRGIKLSQQNVASIEAGDVQRPRALPEIAAVLKTTIDWLRSGAGAEDAGSAETSEDREKLRNEDPERKQRPPLLPSADADAEGTFLVASSGERQGELLERTGVFFIYPFTFYYRGNTMTPAIEHGDELVVEPMIPARPNVDCIFLQEANKDGSRVATVKRLISSSTESWQTRQFNPLKEVELSKQQWPYAWPITTINRGGRR